MKFVSFSSFLTPKYIPHSAWLQHIPFAFWLVEQLQPSLLVELGVHRGASYFSFCQGIKENKIPCTCYGIDTWQGDEHAGHYNDNIFNEVVQHNNEHYSQFSYLLRSTFQNSLASFENKTIDLLHIDGYHTYDSVKADFENWLPKLSDRSVVLFHDIAVREREFGVFKLWDELKLRYPHFEFTFGHGLGVLATGSSIANSVNSLLNTPGNDERFEINEIYAGLGTIVSRNFELNESLKQAQLHQLNFAGQAEEIARQQALLQEAQVQNNYLKDRHDNLQLALLEKEKFNERLRAEHARNQAIFTETIAGLNNLVSKQVSAASEISTQLSGLLKRNQELNTTVNLLGKELCESGNYLAALEAKTAELETSNQQLDEEISVFKALESKKTWFSFLRGNFAKKS